MKKIYNQPTVSTVNLMGGFVMQSTSSVVNNNPLPGGSGGSNIPEGN
jgi:hypothetical protein